MRPKKKFGQHFLTSPHVIQQILEAAEIQEGDNVLEIGPGQGALTKHLVSRGAHVTVIEIDPDMQSVIRETLPTVNIIAADASQVDFQTLLDGNLQWKCVSNLPYNVGTKIVQNLLSSALQFTGFTFMLQKEVGVRMLAEVGDRARGSLSTFVQAFGSVSKVCTVPPGAFFPPPNVDSIVIHIQPYKDPIYLPNRLDLFDKVNRALFAQPRKALRNSLKKDLHPDEVAFLVEHSMLDFGLRPAQLTLTQIVDLVTTLEKMPKIG